MKKQNKAKELVSRRQFLGTSAAAAAVLSVGPLSSQCTPAPPPSATGVGIPNSKFGGVQIGTITYSFRGIESTMEGTLNACVESGVSSIELMSNNIEQWCGAPEIIRAPRRPQQQQQGAPGGAPPGGMPGGAPPGGMPGGMPGGQQQEQLTEEEYAEAEKQAAESQEALRQWRLSAPMEKFTELSQMFRDAGVDIHIVKWSPSRWTPEEIDYAFEATKAMGAQGITDELSQEAADVLGPIAEKHGMYAIMHNHMQYAEEGFSADPMLAVSPNVMLNFDCGHYFGSTGLNPCDFVQQYHDRIFSIHLKDKTGPNTDPANANQVWGQGETPLAELLLLIKENQWPIYCDIELEYPIPAWSTSVKEVRTCVNYARQILI